MKFPKLKWFSLIAGAVLLLSAGMVVYQLKAGNTLSIPTAADRAAVLNRQAVATQAEPATLVTGNGIVEPFGREGKIAPMSSGVIKRILVREGAAVLAGQKIGRKLTEEERDQLIVLSDYRKMNQVRARVDSIVKDPATAAALKPWYRQFCKRPCFHDEYLDTYNRPNVTLVDTRGRGVERMTEHSVIANGREYELDCLIFATGFEVGTSFTRRTGYDIVGRDGVTLSSHWGDGTRTLHGMTTNGFPNCFFIGRNQAAVTVNLPLSLQNQTRHIAHMITQSRAKGFDTVEVAQEAVDAYVDEVRSLSGMNANFFAECTPGYYNSEGAAGNKNGFFSETYGAGSLRYFESLAQWRDGGMPGLTMR